MAECFCIKRLGPVLTPASEEDKEILDKLPVGKPIKVRVTRVRNLLLHRKFMALARFAYDYWEPPELEDPKYKNVIPAKSFDRFRKDLIILSGYYEATYRIDGSTRIEAKSIAFDAMNQEDFEKLYQAAHQVVINQICKTMTGEMLDNAIEEALSFAG